MIFGFKPAGDSFKGRVLPGLAVGLSTAAVFCLLGAAGAFEQLELMAFDGWQRHFAKPGAADPDILLLTVDQASVERVEQATGFAFPWPRAFYGKILDFIRRGGPKAVVFDLLFEGADLDREELGGLESDREFARAISRAGPVALGVKLRPADPTPPSGQAGELLQATGLPQPPWPGLSRFDRVDPLAAPLIHSGARFGFVNVTPDGDGTVRRVHLLADAGGKLVPALALQALLSGESGVRLEPWGICPGDRCIPIDGQARAWVRFRGPGGLEGGQGRTYNYLPLANVLFSAVQVEEGAEPIVDAEIFRGKWVMVGSSSSARFDLKATPFSKLGTFPGMEIQATILDNLIHQDFLERIPRWMAWLLLAVACLAVGLLGQLTKKILAGSLAVAGLALLFFAWSYAAFSAGVMLDLVAVEVSLFCTFAVLAFVNFLGERRSKLQIRHIFQHYLDPSVVRRLIEVPEQLKLGGESRVCTAFFSDIVGFTSVAESLSPERLLELMNLYLGEMTEIVLRRGGLLDKYIGDAIMAVFGAPLDLPGHAEAACRAALECHRRLAELSGRLEPRGFPAMHSRIGINTGSMVVGNMGSERRMSYTAMGDAVNLASRLEGANREFSTSTIIGPQTRQALGEGLVTRELDFIRLKGKQQPVRIYELVGEEGRVDAADRERLLRFGQGLSAYRARSFEQAGAIFEEMLRRWPEDGPAKVYLDRCASYLSAPPPGDWDGVFVMTRK